MDVLILTTAISKNDKYSLDLMNMMAGWGCSVHVISNNNFNSSTNLPYDSVHANANDLIESPERVHLYTLKERTQPFVERLYRDKHCKAFIYITKDGEDTFNFSSKLPFLSICVLQLNFENIPPKTRASMVQFSFIVSAGDHCAAAVARYLPDKPATTILPRAMVPLAADAMMTRNNARTSLNLRQDKYIFLLDVGEHPEIRSLDVIVQAYRNNMLRNHSFRDRCQLIVNALPTVQVTNVINLEPFTSDDIALHVQYYGNALVRDESVLHRLIIASNVVLHPVSGGDFDPFALLAQEYGRPLLTHDILTQATYYNSTISITQNQRFMDGISEGFLRIPKVDSVGLALRQLFKRYATYLPRTKLAQATATAFRKERCTFDHQWEVMLDGIVRKKV